MNKIEINVPQGFQIDVEKLTQDELRSRLNYNPDTGIFTYKKSIGCKKIGDIAGSNENGYVAIKINKKIYKAQQLVWLYIFGRFSNKGYELDHINHIKSDNRLVNLREVTHLENTKNARMMKNNKSNFTGVSFHKRDKIWQASICVNYKDIYLGSFNTKEEAIKARLTAEEKYNFHPTHGK